MIRAIVVVAYLLSIFPHAAWAASGELLASPGGAAVAPVRLTGMAPGARLDMSAALPGEGETAPPALAPAAAAPDSAQVDVAQQIAEPEAAREAAREPRERETSLDRLTRFARAAVMTFARPGSAAADKSRVDFVDAKKAEGADAPVVIRPVAPISLPRASGGSESKRLAPEAPKGPEKNPPPSGVGAYLAGVFSGQLANNALIVTMPIVLDHLGLKIGPIGFLTSLTTGIDMSGTLVSGWLTRRYAPETVLKGATWARAAALVAIPALLSAGALSIPAAVALYIADALARGIADTARNTVPVMLVGKGPALAALNSKGRMAFNLGAIAGPGLIGLLALKTFSNAGNWMIAGIFAAAALAYEFVPRAPPAQLSAPDAGKAPAPRLFQDSWSRWALAVGVLVSLSPALRALIPAAFSQAFLRSPSAAAWLTMAFGAGATAGSFAYNRASGKLSPAAWIAVGAAGTLIFSTGLLSTSFAPLAAAIFAFSFLNEMASLAVMTGLQTRSPEGGEGAVTSWLRFTANATSMASRSLIGAAFTVAIPVHAFWIIAGGVLVAALAQFLVSARLRALAAASLVAAAPGPRPSLIHGLPGRLIVVEGLDGSGKSTQMEMLKERLEAQGLKVVTTSWNSSDLISEAVKKAKKAQVLTPDTFALLNATDFTERLNKVIVPALQEGAIVLADRYFYTALARDSVRGNSPSWLKNLYASSLRPDLVLYFKLPIETAIGRVLARGGGKLNLSEDFDDDDEAAPKADTKGVKYYEGGLDVKLSDDPIENFKMFQTKVTASYDAQAKENAFTIVDATRAREVQHAEIFARVESALGPLSLYKRQNGKENGPNLFDKDPAQDAEHLRRNYMHEKRGAHFYFRNMLFPMQERFAQLLDNAKMPRVFLHGNPHVDNYSRSAEGAAMVDFDRSRVGPYAWDLLRLMVSLSLRQKKEHGFLDPKVLKALKKGYLHGLRHPDKPFSEMRKLKNTEPEEDQVSTDAYIKANKKWIKELRDNPMPVDSAEVKALIAAYVQNCREPALLKDYFVEEAGRGFGTMGNGRILFVLAPRDAASGRDRILLEIKQTYADADSRFYKNPFAHQGERMVHASDLYAPGWDRRQAFLTYQGVQYWAHQIPPQNVKLKKMLNVDEEEDFAYSVGTQLGRGHALSAQDGASAGEIEAHLEAHYKEIALAGAVMREEIVAAHERYLKNMLKRGLEPKRFSENDD